LVGLTLGATSAAAPALEEPGATTATTRVLVKDNFFEPRSLSVRRGARVTWMWRGKNAHNVTFTKVPRGASKRGADTRRRGRFTRSFGKPGLYKYVCTNHYGQRGSIEVEAP
jgi:plastocyanin